MNKWINNSSTRKIPWFGFSFELQSEVNSTKTQTCHQCSWLQRRLQNKAFYIFLGTPDNPLSEIFMTLPTAESTDMDPNVRLGESVDNSTVI